MATSKIIKQNTNENITFPIAMEYVGEEFSDNPNKKMVILFLSPTTGVSIVLENTNNAGNLFEYRTSLIKASDKNYWRPFKGKIELEFP